MKTKTIKAVLRKKIDAWLASIEDDAVRSAAARDTIVTGGAIASMLLREKVNDYDIYFRTRETALAVAKYYISRFHPTAASGRPGAIFVDEAIGDRIKIVIKSAGIASEKGTSQPYEYFEARDDDRGSQYIEKIMTSPGEAADALDEAEEVSRETTADEHSYRPVFMSSNAITLSDRIQIIMRFYGSPEEIHENYDFVHCTNYWDSHDGELHLRPEALEALLTKELRYVGSKYPVCSIIRTRKFVGRSWTINAGQILKMVLQAAELDLKDPGVLEEQLTGVDVAYFAELLAKIRHSDSQKVNSAYLIEIIDRMF